jgi:hypothetical protein
METLYLQAFAESQVQYKFVFFLTKRKRNNNKQFYT